MNKEIPYYILDLKGNSERLSSDNPAYIDDEELRELLVDFLGDSVPESEIQKILDAASDEKLSEEDFDKLIDEFILKNKK
ncbi:MAG: hypothetical protein IJI42_05875 [Methanobrevibacter sp.]|uniref:hypothetical protein n=1 Tax=Methanobrevibacter sp. TaxID=66852 RepID=UPI00386B5C89|nr:hypothetical protein [Methanobrevibacter sp.]